MQRTTRPRPERRGLRALRRDPERGAASVEAALVFPALILLFFTIVNGAVYLHAGNVAQGVAQAAFEEARVLDGSNEASEAAGYASLEASGGLENANVVVNRGPTTVTVTVTGQAPVMIPGLPVDVSRSITGAVERWSE